MNLVEMRYYLLGAGAIASFEEYSDNEIRGIFEAYIGHVEGDE